MDKKIDVGCAGWRADRDAAFEAEDDRRIVFGVISLPDVERTVDVQGIPINYKL
ncbi:MAG: hypothetical protein U9N09_04390 [Euryarchaeota archaeon]|nr:hypothetical protein [Euryarchaeota archaeon]